MAHSRQQVVPHPHLPESALLVHMFRALVDGLESFDAPLDLRGPLFQASHSGEIARLRQFRDVQYRDRLAYLLCDDQLRLERSLTLDERSAHFSAERNRRVVACVRTTPAPFEFEALSHSLAQLAPSLRDHVELSRLLVQPGDRSPHVTTRLLAAACTWAVKEGYAGVVGLCRLRTRPLLERYGLTAASEVRHVVRYRSTQPYLLMAGRWPALIGATTRLHEKINRARRPEPSAAEALTTE